MWNINSHNIIHKKLSTKIYWVLQFNVAPLYERYNIAVIYQPLTCRRLLALIQKFRNFSIKPNEPSVSWRTFTATSNIFNNSPLYATSSRLNQEMPAEAGVTFKWPCGPGSLRQPKLHRILSPLAIKRRQRKWSIIRTKHLCNAYSAHFMCVS